MNARLFAAALSLALGLLAQPAWATPSTLQGVVRDQQSGRPIAQATVVLGPHIVVSDERGGFSLTVELGPTPSQISARAPGYRRSEKVLPISTDARNPHNQPAITLSLSPLRAKGVYLSVYGIGSSSLRGEALALIEKTELNTLVIDVKGDRGLVPYRSAVLARAGLGPQTIITVRDMPALLKDLRARGLYLIARIVTFKDDPLVAKHPQWAVRDAQGAIWKDREGLAWIDPFQRAAWTHSLDMAEEAAQLGFDEVQFDYVRFPDAVGLSFSQPNHGPDAEAARVAAIGGFLTAARQRLAPYNVFISADIFGYVSWNSNDTQIGQQLEALAGLVDYLCPMLYPSGFHLGIPEHRNPMEAPYEIVERSLRHAIQRTGLPGTRFRPWLQAFRDYAFDHRDFGELEIRRQIEAADSVGSSGWLLWNPKNRYGSAGLAERKPPP
ncbi:putative glycoside hydrolase [Paucibacter sp. AS339]|uniref:putative glycoside hydrolase n=1 Tax=Paucibacter hankyongi TaxID=3133434 RepID=UPI0030ADF479